MNRISRVRRIFLAKANQDIYVVRHPILIESIRIRCPYLKIDLNNPATPNYLISKAIVNDFLEVPVTPVDAMEDMPAMLWNEIRDLGVDHVKIRWDTTEQSWADVLDAMLEVWVIGQTIGRQDDVERADPGH